MFDRLQYSFINACLPYFNIPFPNRFDTGETQDKKIVAWKKESMIAAWKQACCKNTAFNAKFRDTGICDRVDLIYCQYLLTAWGFSIASK